MSEPAKYLSRASASDSPPTPPVVNRSCWATPQDVVRYAGRHYTTVRRALHSGELHGHQKTSGGRWAIDLDCVDAWLRGDTDSAAPCDCPEGRRARDASGITLHRR